MGTTFFVEGVNKFFVCTWVKMALGEVMFLAWVKGVKGWGDFFSNKRKYLLAAKLKSIFQSFPLCCQVSVCFNMGKKTSKE